MEENEISACGEAIGTAAVAKPTMEIARIMSNEFLKITELKEYSNFLESDVKKLYEKVEKLISAKSDSGKLISEYNSRNRINAINSESLLQALNELHRYKCELKANYLAAEKSLKMKKLKYKKIILSYESAWENVLKEYQSDPTFVELKKIVQENKVLEGEINKQEKLICDTESAFNELEKKTRKAFTENIVKFSEAMIQYKQFLNSSAKNRRTETQKIQNGKKNFVFKLFEVKEPPFRKNSCCSNSNDDANYSCSIDVSVFDEIMIPSENLESQNLEEEAYSFTQSEGQQSTEISKDEEEAMEYLINYQQSKNRKSFAKDPKLNPVQVNEKAGVAEDNESQYFRGEVLKPNESREINKQKDKLEVNVELRKEKMNPRSVSIEIQQNENEAEASKDMQMECEESSNEGSYEKQMELQRAENYDCQKSSSCSFEEYPPARENPNGSAGPTGKPGEENNSFKPNPEPEKNNFKPFTFFTMDSEQSIFKLF